MVALQGYERPDKSDQSGVTTIIEQNPDIRMMVEKIAGHAASYFGWMTVSFDTKQYDEWDPPLRMTITVPYAGEEGWARQYREFKTWLMQQDDYDLDRLAIMILPRVPRNPEE